MPYAHKVDQLWDERLQLHPRTRHLYLTDHVFYRDCQVTKMVLVKVYDVLARRHGPWMADETVRESLVGLIDDAQIDRNDTVKQLAAMIKMDASVLPFLSKSL